jgi:hypothetical protein
MALKNRWVIYFTERFPLPVNIIVSAGLAITSQALAGTPNQPAWIAAFWGSFLFSATLRFMDETKDYEKDKVAHPKRPLPRGLFTVAEFSRAIWLSLGLMVLTALACALWISTLTGVFYLGVTLYLYLMYKEFFVGESLNRAPLLYAISHQIVILGLAFFVMEAYGPEHRMLGFTLGIFYLGTFFTYEVCRKLDPKAHPVLKTYLSIYGRAGSAAIAIVTGVLSLWAARELGLLFWIAPLIGLTWTSLVLMWADPTKHKWIEGMATLSLLMHLWAVPLARWVEGA